MRHTFACHCENTTKNVTEAMSTSKPPWKRGDPKPNPPIPMSVFHARHRAHVAGAFFRCVGGRVEGLHPLADAAKLIPQDVTPPRRLFCCQTDVSDGLPWPVTATLARLGEETGGRRPSGLIWQGQELGEGVVGCGRWVRPPRWCALVLGPPSLHLQSNWNQCVPTKVIM